MSEAASKKQTTIVPNTELVHGLWFCTIKTGAETLGCLENSRKKMFIKQHHPPKEVRELCGGEKAECSGNRVGMGEGDSWVVEESSPPSLLNSSKQLSLSLLPQSPRTTSPPCHQTGTKDVSASSLLTQWPVFLANITTHLISF